MKSVLWLCAVFLAAILVGRGLFLAAGWRERRRTGAPLTPERAERVGVRVGTVVGVVVFIVMSLWAGVTWKVLSAAAVAVSAHFVRHTGIARTDVASTGGEVTTDTRVWPPWLRIQFRGTAWEPTPWRAVQRAAWAALERA